jgi:hypothetical protein
MEEVRSFETYVELYQTLRCYIPEDSIRHIHSCDNLKYNLTSETFISYK